MRHTKLGFLIVLLFFAVLPEIGDSGNRKGASHLFSFKDVILEIKPGITSEYEYGKEAYPAYSKHGLPGNFWVKRDPDLSFSKDDIGLIKIERTPSPFFDRKSFQVTIHLNSDAAEMMRAYSERKLNKLVALAVDDKILGISKIINIVSSELVIHINRIPPKKIEEDFRKVCDNVIVDLGSN